MKFCGCVLREAVSAVECAWLAVWTRTRYREEGQSEGYPAFKDLLNGLIDPAVPAVSVVLSLGQTNYIPSR